MEVLWRGYSQWDGSDMCWHRLVKRRDCRGGRDGEYGRISGKMLVMLFLFSEELQVGNFNAADLIKVCCFAGREGY